MIRRSICSLALALAAAALPLSAPAEAKRRAPDVIPTVKVPAISVDTMRDLTRTLASDAFEGRSPGTPGEDKTVALLIQRFKAAGLKPGNKGKWTQQVPTVIVSAQNPSPLSVSAGGQQLSFAFGSEYVAGTYRFVPQIAVKDAPLVFVGYGINAPELGWNDYAGIDMKGKVALILVNDPDYEMADESGPFKGRRMTYYGRWRYKFEEAARQGAAGALIVHDTYPAAYGWQVVQSSWTGKQKYVDTPGANLDQTLANGWMQKATAEAILKASGQDLAALSAAAKQKGFKPVPLGAAVSLNFGNAIARAMSHNVIGIQPGRTRPNDYVLYTAHWDHLGRCKADATGDDICNGAIDNATGTAALVALAEANRKAGPAARSQVFLAVTLEESGLLGSEFYARNPVYPLARTVGGVNMDVIFPGSPARDVGVTGGDKSELTRYLEAATRTMGLAIKGEDHPERGSYYRSDHFSFAKRGVPMFAVGRGSDWVSGGKAAGDGAGEAYNVKTYHQPSDEFREDWDWSGPLQEATLLYRLGRMLADGNDWPNWHPGDEFRLIRDRDRAGVKAGK